MLKNSNIERKAGRIASDLRCVDAKYPPGYIIL